MASNLSIYEKMIHIKIDLVVIKKYCKIEILRHKKEKEKRKKEKGSDVTELG